MYDDDQDPEDFRGLGRTERIEQSFNGLGLLKIYNSDFTKIERECRSQLGKLETIFKEKRDVLTSNL